jgi:cytochrome c oxidase assembly factor CtaG
VDVPSPLTSWTFDPLQLVPLVLLAVVYWRRCRTLAQRGLPVPRAAQVWFALGVTLLLIAFASPVHELGEETFLFMHMVQHVIVGDLAPLAIVAGLTGPVLRPLLTFRAIERLRVLAHPLVAMPLWGVNLYVWHLPSLYDDALHDAGLHALQHGLFFALGAAMWAAVLEPLPGPAWFGTGAKLLYVVGVRLTAMVLGNIIAWSGEVFYPTYDHAPVWGISAAADQGIAGSVMMVVDSVVTISALAWLFLRLGAENEERQRLIESGVDPQQATRMSRRKPGALGAP